MTITTAELAVTGHVGEVALALGPLMDGLVVTWSDDHQAWRMDVTYERVQRTFWFSSDGWRYEWLGRSWWRPLMWAVPDGQRLAAELVLVLAGLVAWPASTRGQQDGGEQSTETEGALVSQ